MRLLTEATGNPGHYVFLLENPSHKRKDIAWWEGQSVKRIGDLLRRHELLPLIPSGASKTGLQMALSVTPSDEYVRALPVMDLVAAAGAFSASQSPEVRGWLSISEDLALDRACFVAKMVGASMPTPDGDGVPNGSWVMFRRYESAPPPQALDGRRVLVQLRDVDDPDTGGR